MAFEHKIWIAEWRRQNPKKYAAQRKREYAVRRAKRVTPDTAVAWAVRCSCKAKGKDEHLDFCAKAKR